MKRKTLAVSGHKSVFPAAAHQTYEVSFINNNNFHNQRTLCCLLPLSVHDETEYPLERQFTQHQELFIFQRRSPALIPARSQTRMFSCFVCLIRCDLSSRFTWRLPKGCAQKTSYNFLRFIDLIVELLVCKFNLALEQRHL